MNPTNADQPRVDCNAILELIADYAFGLTTPEETKFVEANLSTCPEAVAQLADYQGLQDDMRASVAQIDPSPLLVQRLLMTVGSVSIPAPISAAPPTTSRRNRWLGWLAAAAVIALVATNVYWFSRVNDLSVRHDELAEALASRDGNALVVSESDTEDLRWVRLPAQTEDAGNAVLVWNPESSTGLLYAREFPVLEPGKTYQLWLNRGENRISAGTFEVNDEGTASYLFHIGEPIDNYAWARVTAEPDTGSPQPSGAVVVAGELET